jgi:hypothetical protein
LLLSYLRAYVYEDPGLVIALLSDSNDELQIARGVVKRVTDRLERLVNHRRLAADVAAWAGAVEDGDLSKQWLGLGVSEWEETEAYQQIESQLFDYDLKNDDQANLAGLAYMNHEERRFMMIGEIPVQIKCDGSACIAVVPADSNICFDLPDDGLLPPGEAELFVVTASSARWMTMLVVSSGNCAPVWRFGKIPEGEWDIVRRFVLNRRLTWSIHEDLETKLDEYVHNSALEITFNHVQRQCRIQAETLYLDLATLIVADEHVPRVKDALSQSGLAGLLEYDEELLRALAAIGLGNSVFGTDKLFVAGFTGVDPDAADRLIRDYASPAGMPLLISNGDHVVALV